MARLAERSQRVFKTAWFAKAAAKTRIVDDELCAAFNQVLLGQADDLGGGVFKKRLYKNLDRSIILARSRTYWVFEYLFAKKDRSNIEHDELLKFRKLASIYETYTEAQVASLIRDQDWREICHEDPKEVQEQSL